jgi:hypothetical protein
VAVVVQALLEQLLVQEYNLMVVLVLLPIQHGVQQLGLVN